jgi:hypothetical protein
MGKCPVAGGTLVPILKMNVEFRKLPVIFLYNRLGSFISQHIDRINERHFRVKDEAQPNRAAN